MKKTTVVDKETCTECGSMCCKYALRRVPVVDLDSRHAEFFEAKSVEHKLIGQSMYYVLNQWCPNLTDEGCGLGDKRPAICKEFPPYRDDDWHHFCPLSQKLYKSKGL